MKENIEIDLGENCIIDHAEIQKLFVEILYQTHYMTSNHGNTEALSQMAREDGISSWSIENKIRDFATKNDITL
jgi:hypothetical protein